MTDRTEKIAEYVSRFGGRCRDCADENGICPQSGLPCGNSKKAIRHVLAALQYGLQHGHIDAAAILASVPPQGEPAVYGYVYPDGMSDSGTVERFGTNGRTINGSKPLYAIPYYAHPPSPPDQGEALDDKLVYIKPLRTLVRVQTQYADKIRDLCNAAPSDQGEAVAWEYEWALSRSNAGAYSNWAARLSFTDPRTENIDQAAVRNVRPLYAAPLVQTPSDMPPTPTEREELLTGDIRWAVNALLESIAVKFEAWDTWDLFRSDAASTVRSFKHDLTNVQTPAQVSGEQERKDAIEACAKLVEKNTGAKPCDCIEETGGFLHPRCYCQNSGDHSAASAWCADMNTARNIRELIAVAPQGDSGTKGSEG